tara:strand:- start:25 stop:1659 length:1635 start_codon:yes stop_codon:yes gene_type:complete
MRYREIKLVESIVALKEAASIMSAGNWLATAEKKSRVPIKYVIAAAKSIDGGKYFQYIDGKEEKSGIVDSITVNDEEMSAEEWQNYATDNYPEFVKTTKFIIDGEAVPINKLLKNESIKGSLVPNQGDIAEAVLGSAIAAKFARGGRDINKDDVIRILKDVVAQGIAQGSTDYQTSGVVEDEYKFTLTLNSSSLKPLKLWMDEADPMGNPSNFDLVQKFEVDPSVVKKLQKQVLDAVEYANNNKRATTAVDKAKLEMTGKNEISIISDGGDATQQSITKVDLKLEFDGKPQRLLSLKAGTVKQFGQISGAEWEVASDFFESIFKFRLDDSMKTAFGFKGKDQDDYKDYNYNMGPFAKMYSEMAKQVQAYTAGDDTQKEYNLVKHVYDAINFHATRGEENVTMVILSPSAKIAYKELAFDARLLSALELYDLRVVNEAGLKNHKISIVGELKTDKAVEKLGKNGADKLDGKSILVQLRTAVQGSAIRNIVEMGDLLKTLANVEKLDKDQAERNTAAAQPAAGNQSAPVAAPAPKPKQPNNPNQSI